jgi:hypothetical protein
MYGDEEGNTFVATIPVSRGDLFSDDVIVYDEQGNDIALPVDNIILRQFTGLQDKSGKEIYEGDIVRQLRCRCAFCQPHGEWRVQVISDFDYLSGNSTIARSEAIEVIGNIYENPGLLGAKT